MQDTSIRSLNAAARTLLLLTLSVASASHADRVTAAEPPSVEIKGMLFEPKELTVRPGTTVVWVNRDPTIHNIVSKEAQLSSPGLDTDDRFTFRFDREGDFTYHCGLHPQMVGVVHVRSP